MYKLHTIPLLLVVTLLLSGTAPRQSDVIIEAREPGQQEMAEWAVARYAEAGLDLPQLVVRFSGRDLSNCGGAPGRVYLDRDPIEVRMCWNSEFVLLHELAHAWEAHNVPAAKHEPFMAMRNGVVSWAGLDVAWDERGREHAANVVAWGLLEDPYPISRTYPNDPDSLLAAFQFLTGTHPLHDGGEPIQLPDRSLFAGRSNPPIESGR
jgi:hypothetical protein